jgi:hypothetical protein
MLVLHLLSHDIYIYTLIYCVGKGVVLTGFAPAASASVANSWRLAEY